MDVVTKALAAVGRGQDSGMCERFTRSCFGFPARYASARLAYEASRAAGPIHMDNNPPPGVPVFWDITTGVNSPFDHVAVSVGDGYVVSTSAGPGRTVARVGITELTRRWGMTYRGWAEFYHDQRVYTPPTKSHADPQQQPPQPQEDDNMALTPADRDEIAEGVLQALNGTAAQAIIRKLIREQTDPIPANSARITLGSLIGPKGTPKRRTIAQAIAGTENDAETALTILENLEDR